METYEPYKSNREKKQTPLKNQWYYCGCDRSMMSGDGRCDVCGAKHKSGRLKTEKI